MKDRLGTLGGYAGYLGTLICLLALVGRFYGAKPVMGYQAINIFVVGTGILVWACWARLMAR